MKAVHHMKAVVEYRFYGYFRGFRVIFVHFRTKIFFEIFFFKNFSKSLLFKKFFGHNSKTRADIKKTIRVKVVQNSISFKMSPKSSTF